MATCIRATPRKTDEQVLEALRLRRNGWSWKQIAARVGGGHRNLMVSCHRVRDADAAESGEDVLEAYQ